jgi:hypothetical protein
MSAPKVQLLQRRNTLREKVGGNMANFDQNAVARAEAALQSLSGQFQQWMEEETNKLHDARNTAKANQWVDADLDTLYTRAHDVKGLAGTYEYPIGTRIAASLCRMIETPEARENARKHLNILEAHVDAIRAAVQGKIKTEDHPVGRQLLLELEGRVAKMTAANA